jgi:pilus assembly protein Flp/PilA
MKAFRAALLLTRKEDGATALEYAFIASLISTAAFMVLGTIGTNLSTTFNSIATKL